MSNNNDTGGTPKLSLAEKCGIKKNQIVQPTVKLGSGKTIEEPEEIAKVRKSLHAILNDKGDSIKFNTYKKVKTKDGGTGYTGIEKTLKQCITTEDDEGLITVHHFQIFKTEYTTDSDSMEFLVEDTVTTQ